jgi:hypothetical protein
MKKCSYCGKEYPDEAMVCAIDGEPLPGSVIDRKKVTGVWRGVYGYGEPEKRLGLMPVAFTLKLKQGWLDHFSGSVTEDPPHGMPGTGEIDGYFSSLKLEFNKVMPVDYVATPDGSRLTLREFIIAEGHACERELPAAPIFYQGTFLDANRVQGTWIIQARTIRLSDGTPFPTGRASGFWCAEFISSDLKVNPAGGPTEPLFDKTLLSPRELEDVEGAAFLSLGRYNVADSEKFLDQFVQENIRFELKRDDAAMRQMMPIAEVTGGYAGTAQMIEIFIHPDDEEAAKRIVNEHNKV